MARDGKRRIVVEFLGQDTSAGKTASDVEKRFGKFGATFEKAGKIAGTALAGGLVLAGGAAVKLGQQASDLGETQSKVNQIFGEQGAAALDKFASGAAKSMGQSKQAALDGAASFGMFGKLAGLTGSKLISFSTDLTTLASDMASFGNTTPQEAIDALGSALRGEAEPIRAYGVLLDDATLKAEAMRLGLLKATKDTDKIKAAQISAELAQKRYNEAVKEHGKGSKEARSAEAALIRSKAGLKKATEGTIGPLTQQQKVLAAQSAITRQTKDQQGDFARTSDGLANKQRILKAQMENFGTTLGVKVLPAMLKLTDAGMQGLAWIEKHQKAVGLAVVAVGGLAAAVWTINVAMRAWIAVTQAWAVVSKVAAAAQWLLNVAMSANPIGLIVIALAGLAAGLVVAYKKSETFRRIVDAAFRAVGAAAQFVFNWVKKNWPYLVGVLAGPFGIAVVYIARHWSQVKAGALAVVTWIKDRFLGLVNFYKSMPGRMARAAVGLFDGIKEAFRAAINFVIRGWNGLQFKIPGFDPPGPIGKIGGFTLGVPRINELAAGGIVRARQGGTLALLGEAGHDEAVIPLSGPHAPRAAGSAGAIHVTAPLVVKMDSKTVWQGLLELKRSDGIVELGLA